MIAIVDYKAGNLASVQRAVEHLGYECEITSEPDVISQAERLIFPGVGAAGAAMKNLYELKLAQVIRNVYKAGKPLLGICIGVQIIFERSEEDNTKCLGLVKGTVKRFPKIAPNGELLKIPQIGWNQVKQVQQHPIFNGVPDKSNFYFVNSYYPSPSEEEITIGVTNYGVEFTSVVAKNNLVATQFHLEKSGEVGLKMLDNFCKWHVRPRLMLD